MVRNSSRWGATALTLVVWCSGCGGEDPLSHASGPSMQPAASRDAGDDRSQNAAPRIESVRFKPSAPRVGDKVRAVVEASDDDGDRLAYEYTWTVNGVRLAQRSAMIQLSRTRKGEPLQVTVTASDGRASSEPFEATTYVHNRPPQLSGVRFEPSSAISAGATVTARPTALDLDGDTISYRYTWWVNGRTRGGSGPEFSTEGMRRGDTLRVRVEASDGEDESNSVDSTEVTLGNAPPVIVSQPSGAGKDGVFRYQVRAEDPDGDRLLRISLVKGPEGMAMTATRGLIEWRPSAGQGGNHVIEVVVEDSDGASSMQRFSIDLDPGSAGSDAPPPAAPDEDEDEY